MVHTTPGVLPRSALGVLPLLPEEIALKVFCPNCDRSFSSFAENVQTILAKTTDTLNSPANALRQDPVLISPLQQAGRPDQGDPEKIAIQPPTATTPDLAQRPTPVSSFSRAAWSDEEVKKLIRLREGNGDEQIPFEDFVHEFPGRTANSMRQRYYKIKPKQQNSHWKKQKTTLPNDFQQGDHDAVADEPTLPSAPARWSDEDDKKLLRLRQGNGNGQVPFEDFLHEFPGRTLRATQRRHDILMPKILSKPPEIDVDAIEDEALLSDDEQDENLEVLPLLPEEIASKVFCPNRDRGCARWFATFTDANSHAARFCDKRIKEGPFPCPWADAVGCTQMFSTRSSIASHSAVHNKHPTGNPFPCRRGCGTNWPNRYILTTHESRCGLQKAPKDKKLIRISFPSKSYKEERPSIIVIARTSGNYIPKSWYGGFTTLKEGLQS
jgi:hypothetical protein